MKAKRLQGELSGHIQEAYRNHVRRVSSLFGRDVTLSREVATMVENDIPIMCSVASHCVAYVGGVTR